MESMTCKQLIESIVNDWKGCGPEDDTAAKLITLAYHMGREAATKEVSDDYNALLAAQRERAKACRYHRMAAAVIGDERYIYNPDYRGDVTAEFASDKTALTVEALR